MYVMENLCHSEQMLSLCDLSYSFIIRICLQIFSCSCALWEQRRTSVSNSERGAHIHAFLRLAATVLVLQIKFPVCTQNGRSVLEEKSAGRCPVFQESPQGRLFSLSWQMVKEPVSNLMLFCLLHCREWAERHSVIIFQFLPLLSVHFWLCSWKKN